MINQYRKYMEYLIYLHLSVKIVKKDMNKQLYKFLLIITIVIIVFSCNRSPNNELDQTDTLEFYNIPDKYKNNSKIIQLVQDFNRDKTITNKYGSNLYLTESKTSTIVLSGVRNKHVWFKIYDVDNWLTITEYLSPDTVIDSYTWDLPYGEKRSVLFGDYLKVFIDKYFQIDESEIVKMQYQGKALKWDASGQRTWDPEGDLANIHNLEFKTGSECKSYISESKNQNGRVYLGYNSVFYEGVCYNSKGDTLYALCSDGSYIVYYKYNINQDKEYVFISTEDVMEIIYRNGIMQIARRSLKTGETIWSLNKETEHTFSESIKQEFTINQIGNSVWNIKCLIATYSGTKVQFTINIDVDNPPSELTINEEEL